MEPDGILNACTTKVRMSMANNRAIIMDWAYSQKICCLVLGLFCAEGDLNIG